MPCVRSSAVLQDTYPVSAGKKASCGTVPVMPVGVTAAPQCAEGTLPQAAEDRGWQAQRLALPRAAALHTHTFSTNFPFPDVCQAVPVTEQAIYLGW